MYGPQTSALIAALAGVLRAQLGSPGLSVSCRRKVLGTTHVLYLQDSDVARSGSASATACRIEYGVHGGDPCLLKHCACCGLVCPRDGYFISPRDGYFDSPRDGYFDSPRDGYFVSPRMDTLSLQEMDTLTLQEMDTLSKRWILLSDSPRDGYYGVTVQEIL